MKRPEVLLYLHAGWIHKGNNILNEYLIADSAKVETLSTSIQVQGHV